MEETLQAVRSRLKEALSDFEFRPCSPLIADKWISSSLLQKAIRRGDVETAHRASQRLLQFENHDIWRRLTVIAFEDVGIGSPEALVTTIAATGDARTRREIGDSRKLVAYITELLATATKDRSADFLICAARSHPKLQRMREVLSCAPISHRLAYVADNLSLEDRATAAWYSSGIEWRPEQRVGRGDLSKLTSVFSALGVPNALAEATECAARQTREPIVVVLPLIWLESQKGTPHTVITNCLPPSTDVAGLPLYALDKHTRIGRKAIAMFSAKNELFRASLTKFVQVAGRREASYIAAFYVDAAPVLKSLDWGSGNSLYRLGLEADLLPTGIEPNAIDDLLKVMRDNLDHLNMIRAQLVKSEGQTESTAATLPLRFPA